MGGEPCVSVLMPMRNASRYVAQAVRSVLSQETCPHGLELVIIDDQSTDDSADIVRALDDPRIRLLQGRGRGIPAAMNAALEAARGEFAARCDADDYFLPCRLRRQLEFLHEHPEYDVVCGRFAVIPATGEALTELGRGPSREVTDELRAGEVHASFNTYLMRTRIARSIGGFRDFFVSGSDVDFQFRLGEVCRTYFQAECRYAYRLHDDSITHTQPAPERLFYEAAARRMQLQRSRHGVDDLQRGRPPSPPGGVCTDARDRRAAAHIQGILLGRAWREHASGHRLSALRTGMRALAANPRGKGALEAWRSVAALAIKSPQMQRAAEHASIVADPGAE